MQFDAAQILRQSIASTKFDAAASDVQKADTSVESGVAMGFGVKVESDPLADLMDSMEELSFQFEEDEEMEVAERQLGEAKQPSSSQIASIQTWMKMMPDMPGLDFIRRRMRTLRAADPPPGAEEILSMLEEGSEDPSVLFALLDCLESGLADDESSLRHALQDAKALLEREKGPEMRAGLNVAEEINKRTSSPEEIRDLRDLYRGEVVGFSSPQHCFRSLLASRGAGRLAEALDFLISAAGVDLQSASPSQSVSPAAPGTYSSAPMSGLPSRGCPSMSNAENKASVPESMAGDPGRRWPLHAVNALVTIVPYSWSGRYARGDGTMQLPIVTW